MAFDACERQLMSKPWAWLALGNGDATIRLLAVVLFPAVLLVEFTVIRRVHQRQRDSQRTRHGPAYSRTALHTRHTDVHGRQYLGVCKALLENQISAIR